MMWSTTLKGVIRNVSQVLVCDVPIMSYVLRVHADEDLIHIDSLEVFLTGLVTSNFLVLV